MREAGPFADAVLAEAARRGVPAEVWYQIRAADEVVVVDGVVDRSVSGRRTLAAVTVQARGRRGSAVGTPSNDPVALLDDALAVAAALPPGPALPLADRVHRAGDSADVDVSSPGVLGLSSALVESARSVRPLGGAVEFRARGETAHTTVATTSGGHLEQVTSLASVRTRVTSRGAAVGFVSHDVYAPDAGALLPALDAESLRPVVATADILARTPVPLAAVPGPVWLHGRVAAGLIAMLAPALLLDGVLHGRSRLAGRVGQSVARAGVSVRDDVTGPSSPVRITFDDEGVATRPTTLIEDGALRGYLADRYWAERGGGESTGSGWRGANGEAATVRPACLLVEVASEAVDPAGLHVVHANGMHVSNDVTGDFSFGASGLLVHPDGGRQPVEPFTVAGNLYAVLHGIIGVAGPTTFTRGGGALYGSQDLLVQGLTLGT